MCETLRHNIKTRINDEEAAAAGMVVAAEYPVRDPPPRPLTLGLSPRCPAPASLPLPPWGSGARVTTRRGGLEQGVTGTEVGLLDSHSRNRCCWHESAGAGSGALVFKGRRCKPL